MPKIAFTRLPALRRLLFTVGAMAFLALTTMGSVPASAADCPSHPIKLIVSFPPGNSADVAARSFLDSGPSGCGGRRN